MTSLTCCKNLNNWKVMPQSTDGRVMFMHLFHLLSVRLVIDIATRATWFGCSIFVNFSSKTTFLIIFFTELMK